jgi:membrane peptidoglycan carboxypeptidase
VRESGFAFPLRGALRFCALALLVFDLTLAIRRPPKAVPRREVPRISFYDRTGSVDLSAAGHARTEHFLRQAEQQVRALLCGERRETCPALAGRRLQVVTTLNAAAQEIVERWISQVVPAEPSSQEPDDASAAAISTAPEWLALVRSQRAHNAAAAVLDYRTGEVLAYLGSADPSATTGIPAFQPQFDVLAQGWRQGASAVKPFNYILGIEEHRFTAATLFMDVVTDFTRDGYAPAQENRFERGPVRLRQALQFSLNVPAVKASYRNGLDRLFASTRDWGISYQPGAKPAPSMALGTLELHPIDLLSAYGALANHGVWLPRRYVRRIVDERGTTLWDEGDDAPRSRRVASAAAAFIVTDILAGNTDPAQNPVWGRSALWEDGQRRPAAYKTGTSDHAVDVQAYGFTAPPADPAAPAFAVGVWLGNNDGSSTGRLEGITAAAPLWSAILTDLTRGTPIAGFEPPPGLVRTCVDAHSGLLPGSHTLACVPEYFLAGTEPTQVDDTKVEQAIDQATGLLWVDGCEGPRVVETFLDLDRVEADVPEWRRANQNWIARAALGPGRAGGPRGARTAYFYDEHGAAPNGTTWGAPFGPWATCDRLAARSSAGEEVAAKPTLAARPSRGSARHLRVH